MRRTIPRPLVSDAATIKLSPSIARDNLEAQPNARIICVFDPIIGASTSNILVIETIVPSSVREPHTFPGFITMSSSTQIQIENKFGNGCTVSF
jgi:hypothetical protein